jgi:large-conductance mechanosensitive channel
MKKSLTIVMVVAIILVVCYTIIKMYSESYFWYDEAVQFYDAIGINYDSPNVIHNFDNIHLKNSRYNMDPGGYTLMLHFWTKISMNPFFIRLLNFIFLVVLIFIVVRMTNRCFNENLITLSLLLFLIIFNNAMLIDRAIEVRGYMIEILVVAASVYYLFRGKDFLKQDKFNLKFIGLLLLFCFGMWSRYSAIVSISVGWFLFSLTALNLFSWKAIIGHILLFGNITTIYLVMLRWQNPFGLPMDYLDYLNDFDGWANLLNKNLYFFVLLGFTMFVFVKNMKGDFIATITTVAKRYNTCGGLNLAICYVIFLNAIYFVLSLMGRHPYDPLSSRNFGVTFSTVLVLILF